jgi:GNAT superfamily N-acetyltransferase
MPIDIRDVRPADGPDWRRLWADNSRHWGATLAPAVDAHTWRRVTTPGGPMIGRVAVVDGAVAAFAALVVHEATWTLAPVCYLEDLYVDPAVRRRGIGRRLIEDAIALCHARGYARLYWHTKGDNDSARRLYDSFLPADSFVRYRMMFDV